jgi:hypothetical protein
MSSCQRIERIVIIKSDFTTSHATDLLLKHDGHGDRTGLTGILCRPDTSFILT